MEGLERFIEAQTYAYAAALQELRDGRKRSHWIWYIFPQLKGLGRSYNSEYYGIENLKEAKAYWQHPVLGARLNEITRALLLHQDVPPREILGGIDAQKVKSCMTLFYAATREPLFMDVLQAFYDGKFCNRTITKIKINNI